MARGSVGFLKTTAIKFKKGGWGTRTPFAVMGTQVLYFADPVPVTA